MSDTTYLLLIALPIIFISMSVHELMHAVTSAWLGDDTARLQGRISLNPARHIDPYLTLLIPFFLILSHSPVIFGAAKPVQVNFYRLRHGKFGGALVGMIGPLTNLVLAVLAAADLRLLQPEAGIIQDILVTAVAVNIGFFVFNSIPWPPLDGSRLLYAFAPRPLREAMEAIEGFGMMGLFIFIFLFYQFSSGLGDIIVRLTGALLT
ncbi:site-2 protease family protein [Candidatus Saccharibacteria bacterium]|nr:site-2 protease family protein [Candidatus Saccharibacteria bacterium]